MLSYPVARSFVETSSAPERVSVMSAGMIILGLNLVLWSGIAALIAHFA